MKIFENSDKVPAGYTLAMHVTDNLGRKWKFRASPNGTYGSGGGGSILYFNTLSEIRVWKRNVEDIRAMQEGLPTFRDKVNKMVDSGDISKEHGAKMIKVAYS